MESFTSLTGRAVSLRRGQVDTDQIIPAEYLKRVSRSGFGDGLFAAWRADPGFVLNQPYAEGAEILIAGPDFGIGSSRNMLYGRCSITASRWSYRLVSGISSATIRSRPG